MDYFVILALLSGYVHHYLCLVPQERKFCNSMTADVISDSVKWVNDFSALKAAHVSCFVII